MIVLGIDPGLAAMGYGVVLRQGARLTALDYGVIRTPADQETPARLLTIAQALEGLFDTHTPDQLATERLFFARNEATAFSVGRTVGVVLLTAARRGIPWTEYPPPQVKEAVVGYGAADKHQVQFMVQRILGLDRLPRPDDAADALAVAICHANSMSPAIER